MSAGPVNGAPLLRVGIIGYGVMGKAHSYGYRVRRCCAAFRSRRWSP